jgi:hypothetical protein
MICDEALALLDLYMAALTAFEKSQQPFVAGMLPDHPEYETARSLRQQSHGALLRARKLYRDHIKEHGCRDDDAVHAEVPDAD